MAEAPDPAEVLAGVAEGELKLKSGHRAFKVRPERLREAVSLLLKAYSGEVHLSTITGIDRPDERVIELCYELWVYPRRELFELRVCLPRDEPKVGTISDLIPGALLYELEVYDLLGVVFEGNPHLRKPFLLPEGMERETPLRKDWKPSG